jgi:UDP-glucose 4-epimerase
VGHLKALKKVMSDTGVDAYNLGTGRGYTVLEMIAAFEQASGRKIPYAITDRRPGDVGVCYADPAKARDELDWSAIRGLAEMCEDAWRWQSTNPNGYAEENKVLMGISSSGR